MGLVTLARDSLIPETSNHINSLGAGDPSTDSNQSPATRNTHSLQVESISDPNLPTKILVLRPPASTEIGLQNPLSGSHQISLTNAPGDAGGDPLLADVESGIRSVEAFASGSGWPECHPERYCQADVKPRRFVRQR